MLMKPGQKTDDEMLSNGKYYLNYDIPNGKNVAILFLKNACYLFGPNNLIIFHLFVVYK